MIKTISPYWHDIPWVSPLTSATAISYTLKLWVWSGLKVSVPASTNYEITKQNLASSIGTDRLNVARILNDFITFTPFINNTTGIVSHNNQLWCQIAVEYATTDNNDTGVDQSAVTKLLIKGYGYGDEVENAQPPTNLIHIAGQEYKVTRTTLFGIPIKIDETASLGGTIISRPDREIDVTFDEGFSTDSDEAVKLINIDLSDTTNDTHVEIIYNSVQITLLIEEECRYTPLNVYFMNKEGAQQTLTFFKRREDTLSITKQTFEADNGLPKDGFHQFNDYNIQGKPSFKINSGFVSEDLNEDFTQLLLATKVWTYNGTDMIPLNVETKSLVYKTRAKDRLINYEFEFRFSYNKIQSI